MTFLVESPVAISLIIIDRIFYFNCWQAQAAGMLRGVGSDDRYLISKLPID
jgi:hypothetical protein